MYSMIIKRHDTGFEGMFPEIPTLKDCYDFYNRVCEVIGKDVKQTAEVFGPDICNCYISDRGTICGCYYTVGMVGAMTFESLEEYNNIVNMMNQSAD